MKRTFSTELAYVLGIVFVAWGVVLMEKADFGVSMVVAPAYDCESCLVGVAMKTRRNFPSPATKNALSAPRRPG